MEPRIWIRYASVKSARVVVMVVVVMIDNVPLQPTVTCRTILPVRFSSSCNRTTLIVRLHRRWENRPEFSFLGFQRGVVRFALELSPSLQVLQCRKHLPCKRETPNTHGILEGLENSQDGRSRTKGKRTIRPFRLSNCESCFCQSTGTQGGRFMYLRKSDW